MDLDDGKEFGPAIQVSDAAKIPVRLRNFLF